MLSSNILIPISLLVTIISLDGAKNDRADDCFCYNPHHALTNGTLPCNTSGCSRGNNTICYADGNN